MASSFQLPFLLFLFFHVILLLSNPVHGDDDSGDSMLEVINCHRQSLNLQALTENDNAECLAAQIVDNQLDDQTCTSTTTSNTSPITIATMGSNSQLSASYLDLLKECNININTTKDGVILPICVAKIVATGVACTNCTQSQYSKYLSSSYYTGAGINSGENWMVIVLTTNTSTGSFSTSADLVSKIGLSHCFLLLLLELFLALLN